MNIRNGRPVPDSKSEILSDIIDEYENAFNRNLSPSETAAVVDFAEPIADYMAEQQQDLADVLNARDLSVAEGDSLDKLGQLVGVSRLAALPSESRVQFRSDERVTKSYTIPGDTQVQTDASDSISFNTNDGTQLHYIHGFEDQDTSMYSGDTSILDIQSNTVYKGSYALELTDAGTVVDDSYSIEPDSRWHAQIYLAPSEDASLLYAAEDTSNYYEARIDANSGTIAIDVVDGGSRSSISSTSASISAGEWLEVRVDWLADGTHEVVVFNSSGTEVNRTSGTESTLTFGSGGVGYRKPGAGSAYIDEVNMSRVSALATAAEAGSETNVAAETIVILGSSVQGVDSVTNLADASGGRNREEDEPYRIRIEDQLASGASATRDAMINALDGMDVTRSVTLIVNDTDSSDGDGRPAHSFEPVVDVDSDHYDSVAETIMDTKAVGDSSVGGYDGSSVTRTVEMSNGQTDDITFSVPTTVKIYTDIDLTKTNDYPGDEAVRDSIVQYIGGVLDDGANVDGEIGAGDDVIYYQVLEAVMDVEGVHDVSNLEVGTSSDPSGTSNVSIADAENATSDASDSSLDVSSSDA